MRVVVVVVAAAIAWVAVVLPGVWARPPVGGDAAPRGDADSKAQDVGSLSHSARVEAGRLPPIRASSDDPYLRDNLGRVRVFHGLNAVNKGAPWYPEWLLNETLVAELSSWGMNAMRVGWMWSGYEPSEGQFNATYLQQQQAVVDMLARHGIYSLLDMHQDAMSSKFCTYDGFPLWLVERSEPTHAFPWPYKGNCSSRAWGANELTEACGQAYQDTYDNKHGMRDAHVAFWRQSALQWRNNSNVLGYELINEPFAGNPYANPTILLPGEAGRHNLQPLYDALAAAISEVDSDTLLFFEPGHQRGRSVFSYHYYCQTFDNLKELCDHIVSPEIFRAVLENARAFSGSTFLTEFGGLDSAANLAEGAKIMSFADENFQSWTEYDGFGQTGVFPADFEGYRGTLTRTYARAIAGQPVSMSFDNSTAAFELCYVPQSTLSPPPPTEIFVSFARRYPGGASITATPGLRWQSIEQNNTVLVYPTAAALERSVEQGMRGSSSASTECIKIAPQ